MVIEIASNDGTFLKPFIINGYKKVIGVEPAKNISDVANKNKVKTINNFIMNDRDKIRLTTLSHGSG